MAWTDTPGVQTPMHTRQQMAQRSRICPPVGPTTPAQSSQPVSQRNQSASYCQNIGGNEDCNPSAGNSLPWRWLRTPCCSHHNRFPWPCFDHENNFRRDRPWGSQNVFVVAVLGYIQHHDRFYFFLVSYLAARHSFGNPGRHVLSASPHEVSPALFPPFYSPPSSSSCLLALKVSP